MAAISERNGWSRTGETIAYFAPLTLLVYLVLPNNYLVDIATAFMLKNRLHASAAAVSEFRLVTAIPIYLSFIFGFARDLWNPFGMRDRGYLLIFSLVTVIVFLGLAVLPLSLMGLYVGIFLAMVSFRFIAAAFQGLLALVGQEKLMTGRLTVVWQTTQYVATLGAAFGGGYVAQDLSPQATFVLLAFLTLLIGSFGVLKPRSIFQHAYDQPQAQGADFVGDIKRLVGHRAIYAPILIQFMFSFAPGANTPLQYYLTNALHASDAIYGEFNGIFNISFIPTLLLYGLLCRRYALKTLIWWALIITVPQMIPLALIHSGTQALIMAVPMGLMGGLAVGAIYDLSIRSCPPGLQGSLMMMVDGVYVLASRGSDVLGSAIYDADPKNGFLWCVIATTLVYAAILPVIFLIPRHVIANADGEPNPALDTDVRAEIAA
ncbi:MAG: MFS transporter [Rhizomicrobium sp.]|jgi:MFS family permease